MRVSLALRPGYVWLTHPVTHASVSASAPARAYDSGRAVEVRQFAARRRVITGPGVSWQLPLTLQLLSAEQADLLESWIGDIVLYRDGTGMRRWVTFAGVHGTLTADGRLMVDVTFVGSDFEESV